MASQPHKTQTALAEINVTPLVDVMLVLLIVFMISAPLLQQGLDVNLPKATGTALAESNQPLILTILPKGTLKLQGTIVQKNVLMAKLKALSISQRDPQVLIQADERVAYGLVAQILSGVRASGIKRVGLMTDPSQTQPNL